MIPRTILVVEDNPITRKMMRVALETEGYGVLEAGDGAKGLELAARQRPDLVVQDYGLPDMDGLRLLEGIRGLPGAEHVPALVITGMVSRLDELRARSGASTLFLAKPLAPSRLVEIVRSQLAETHTTPGRGRRVLVVDDEPLNRKLATLRLRDAGFEVETAEGGEEALRKARLSPPDAVLSDVLMPGMDGFLLCRALRREPGLARVPVVLLSSAYVDEDDRRLASEMGANRLVLRTPDLGDAVSALVDGFAGKNPPPASASTVQLDALHQERVQAQLERQMARSEALLRQGAIQAAAFSVMLGLARALDRPQDLPSILGDVLIHCLDAAGLSTGLLYVLEPGGALQLKAQAGLETELRPGASECFGHAEVVHRVLDSAEPATFALASPEGRDPAVHEFVSRLGQAACLIVPFVVLGERFGALVLASDSQDLAEPAWMGFARTLGVQFGQTIALGRSLSRLATSEARYRSFMEHANDAILLLDPGHTILEANRQAQALLGRPKEQIIGHQYDDFVSPEEREDSARHREKLLTQGTTVVASRHLIRADGARVEVEISASLVETGEGQVVLTLIRDLTERRRAEEALRASERQLSSIYGNVADVIYYLAVEPAEQYRFVSVNGAFLKATGFSEDQVKGKLVRDLIPEPSLSLVLGKYLEAVQRRTTVRWEETTPYSAGLKTGEVSVTPIFDVEGRCTHLAGTVHDITERKQAGEALRHSEARMRAVLDAALDAVISMDERGLVSSWNPRAEAIFGWSPDEAVGRKLADMIIPPRHREAHARGLALFLATGEGPVIGRRVELTGLRRDGSQFPVELTVTALKEDDSHLFTAFVADITERKRLEAQLLQSQKMEAVGQLAGGVAHDFNNLLGVITGYCELLLRDVGPEHRGQKRVEQIRKAADRAAALTRQLLAFSRKQVMQPKILDLNDVVADVEKMLRRLIGEDVQLVTIFGADLGHVKADPGQVEQVIVNLAVNARDAMPRGGKLTIETANVELDATYARTRADVRPGPYVLLAVSDTGHGMSAETISHVFEPFFTTKESGKGTGLGLATVYGIVKQSGGHVNVYSEPGRGSTFKVYLPRVDAEGERVALEAAPAPLPPGSETILLVEDAEALRVMIREILEASGYEVLEAPGPEEAVSAAQSHAAPIHVLLTDVVMPRMSGGQLAASLEALRPDLAVVYMSGYTDAAIGHHGTLESGAHFLQKPFTADALLRKLRDVLDAKA